VLLAVKSPWLNPIEPKWAPGKKAIVEPERLLAANEVGRVGGVAKPLFSQYARQELNL
jgi:hypothetical protein